MITDEEFLSLVDEKSGTFTGQLDHYYEAVGMIMVGRHMGWKVMRLVASRRCWTTATKLFGDPKLLMPETAKYTHRSFGLKMFSTVSDYWKFIAGGESAISRDDLPAHQRKLIADD